MCNVLVSQLVINVIEKITKHGVRSVNLTSKKKEPEMTVGEQSHAGPALSFTSNFPIPAPMKLSGDRVNSWNFFRQQWEYYELATGLDKRSQAIRLATFRSVMGKDCLGIFLNLKLTEEQRGNIANSIEALEEYFKLKQAWSTKDIVLIRV